jgi:hypothetical protein
MASMSQNVPTLSWVWRAAVGSLIGEFSGGVAAAGRFDALKVLCIVAPDESYENMDLCQLDFAGADFSAAGRMRFDFQPRNETCPDMNLYDARSIAPRWKRESTEAAWEFYR